MCIHHVSINSCGILINGRNHGGVTLKTKMESVNREITPEDICDIKLIVRVLRFHHTASGANAAGAGERM